jgi:DNA-binding beta-propeller fold protein YncE
MMISFASNRILFICVIYLTSLITVFYGAASKAASQDDYHAPWWKVRSINTPPNGAFYTTGLAYLPAETAFLVLGDQSGDQLAGPHSGLAMVTMFEDPVALQGLPMAIPDPLNVVLDPHTNTLFLFDHSVQELVRIHLGSMTDIPFSNLAVRRSNARTFGAFEPQGMAFNPNSRQVYILDAKGPAIVSIDAEMWNGENGEVAFGEGGTVPIQLNSLKDVRLRGIAFNPANDHWYVLNPDQRLLYELDENGQIISTRDLLELNLIDPQAMLFAPSADPTDDSEIMNLFIADKGGRIVEVSFRESALAAEVEILPAYLVNTIDTSKAAWNPSSPDPAGIAYWPAAGRLLISDSEVEEDHPDFQGVNVFIAQLDGALMSTCDTLDFSLEPTGVAVNPNTNRIYFSDDNERKVFEVDLGPDGEYCTSDDLVTSLDTRAFGSFDPEGVAYGENKLFIADGVAAEVYVVDLGADGVIGGGDDQFLYSFDTFDLGLRHAEGIEYNPDNRSLFIVSDHPNDRNMAEVTLFGWVIRYFDLSFLGSVARSGVAYAPGSQNPAIYNVYISSIGVDNDVDPEENDGKVWEIYLGNPAPIMPLPEVFLPLVLTR